MRREETGTGQWVGQHVAPTGEDEHDHRERRKVIRPSGGWSVGPDTAREGERVKRILLHPRAGAALERTRGGGGAPPVVGSRGHPTAPPQRGVGAGGRPPPPQWKATRGWRGGSRRWGGSAYKPATHLCNQMLHACASWQCLGWGGRACHRPPGCLSGSGAGGASNSAGSHHPLPPAGGCVAEKPLCRCGREKKSRILWPPLLQ